MVQAVATKTAIEEDRQVVVFQLNGQGYGIDIGTAKEIIRCQAVTRVPGVPDSVEGVINLRGEVIPVIDLHKRFGLQAWEQTEDARIIVVEVGDDTIGVFVDAVSEVLRIPRSAIEVPSSLISSTSSSDYIDGIAKVADDLLIMLDLNEALSVEAIRSFSVSDAAQIPPADLLGAHVPGADSDGDRSGDEPKGLPLNIELLEETFAAIAPRGDELVADFYERLFERHPEVQPMFAGADMREQQTKLLGALATVVKSLRKPDELMPVLQELGVRHGELGAVAAHYDAVGPVLLESMAHIAGDAWTDEVEQAWAEAYELIASVMIDAADAADATAAA